MTAGTSPSEGRSSPATMARASESVTSRAMLEATSFTTRRVEARPSFARLAGELAGGELSREKPGALGGEPSLVVGARHLRHGLAGVAGEQALLDEAQDRYEAEELDVAHLAGEVETILGAARGAKGLPHPDVLADVDLVGIEDEHAAPDRSRQKTRMARPS